MIAKIIILILLASMVASLAVAMFTMVREKGRGTGTVKALSYRVGIWAVLFGLIVAGLYTGVIKPGNSLQVAAIHASD